MFKKALIISTYLLATASFSCPRALPTDNPNFCSSFKNAATCYCTSSGLPSGMCQDMNALYNRMLVIFGSLKKACDYQHHTSSQECMDNWNCYMHGGVDSLGRACNSTQKPC